MLRRELLLRERRRDWKEGKQEDGRLHDEGSPRRLGRLRVTMETGGSPPLTLRTWRLLQIKTVGATVDSSISAREDGRVIKRLILAFLPAMPDGAGLGPVTTAVRAELLPSGYVFPADDDSSDGASSGESASSDEDSTSTGTGSTGTANGSGDPRSLAVQLDETVAIRIGGDDSSGRESGDESASNEEGSTIVHAGGNDPPSIAVQLGETVAIRISSRLVETFLIGEPVWTFFFACDQRVSAHEALFQVRLSKEDGRASFYNAGWGDTILSVSVVSKIPFCAFNEYFRHSTESEWEELSKAQLKTMMFSGYFGCPLSKTSQREPRIIGTGALAIKKTNGFQAEDGPGTLYRFTWGAQKDEEYCFYLLSRAVDGGWILLCQIWAEDRDTIDGSIFGHLRLTQDLAATLELPPSGLAKSSSDVHKESG